MHRVGKSRCAEKCGTGDGLAGDDEAVICLPGVGSDGPPSAGDDGGIGGDLERHGAGRGGGGVGDAINND